MARDRDWRQRRRHETAGRRFRPDSHQVFARVPQESGHRASWVEYDDDALAGFCLKVRCNSHVSLFQLDERKNLAISQGGTRLRFVTGVCFGFVQKQRGMMTRRRLGSRCCCHRVRVWPQRMQRAHGHVRAAAGERGNRPPLHPLVYRFSNHCTGNDGGCYQGKASELAWRSTAVTTKTLPRSRWTSGCTLRTSTYTRWCASPSSRGGFGGPAASTSSSSCATVATLSLTPSTSARSPVLH